MLRPISHLPNSFLAVARRQALVVGLEINNQMLYLQTHYLCELYTRPCTNLIMYKLNFPHKNMAFLCRIVLSPEPIMYRHRWRHSVGEVPLAQQ